ncbi:MAG: transposase [Methylobacter sp.]|nr:MAG: transposase [Methylobacter sp.]
MSRFRRSQTTGASYFFTVVTYRRQAILCDAPVREALREAIETVRARQPFIIEAWVLLPDHLHCIWTLPPGDAGFPARWSMIKRQVSIACKEQYRRLDLMTSSKLKHRESTLWQRRYWEHQIRDAVDFSRHADYIHYNPVKHAYCQQVVEWPYSTFHRYAAQGVYPLNWGGGVNREMVAGE